MSVRYANERVLYVCPDNGVLVTCKDPSFDRRCRLTIPHRVEELRRRSDPTPSCATHGVRLVEAA
jgi:hypothetical protein